MTLSSIILSSDWQEVSVLECILGGLHIGVEVESEPERAWNRLAKSKIDALIVDCDADGSKKFLNRLQHDVTNSAPVVIASGSSTRTRLETVGANFVVEKPISVERAVHTLSAARNMILSERLRYHRQGLNLPVSMKTDGGKSVKGHIMNMSRGGARIRTRALLSSCKTAELGFALPGRKLQLKIRGEIAWSDNQGNMGIRFRKLQARDARDLQFWLERQYFVGLSH